MNGRQFLTLGTAVMAAPALPSVTTTAVAAPPPGTLPPRAEIIALVRRVADHWIATHSNSGDNGLARAPTTTTASRPTSTCTTSSRPRTS